MKSIVPNSACLLLTFLLPSLPLSAQSIGVNFGSNEPSGLIDTSGGSNSAGAIPVSGEYWNNAAGADGSLTGLTDSNGNATTGSVTWTSQNTWRSGASGTGTSQNGVLTKGYLDDGADGASGNTINMTSPFLLNDIYVIVASDDGGGGADPYTASAFSVNGTFYKGDGAGGTTIASGSGDSWTAQRWENADSLAEGTSYIKVSDQAAVSIAGLTSSPGRASIGGIQVENAYTGTLSFWDIDGATAGAGGATPTGNWADANWSASAAGDAATANWTGGNAAVFSAGSDATGAYTVTLGGTENADAVWVQEGDVTLTGGTLALGTTGLLRADGTLTVDSALTATNLTTTGDVTLNSASNSVTGLATINGTTTLGANNIWGQVTGGGTLDLQGNSLTVGDATNSTGPSIVGSAGSALDKTGTGTLTVANVLDSLSAITISGGELSLTGGGNTNWTLSGGGTLTKTGGGTLTIGSTGNTFTGKTNVTGGILRVADQTALGSTPGAPVADHITLSGGARIQGGTAGGGADITLDANRGITLAGGNSGFHTWTGFTTTVDGAISGTGNLTKSDGGTLILNGGSTHTGDVRVEGGVLDVRSAITSADNIRLSGTSELVIGPGSTITTDRIVTADGGSAQSTVTHNGGILNVTGTNNANNTGASILFGHWGAGGASSTYNFSAGEINATGAEMSFGWDSGNVTMNQTGGTANLLGLDFGNGRNNAATYNLEGGTLNIGANGITNASNKTLNLGGGTLGSLASWSSAKDAVLTGTGGDVSISPSAGHVVTLSGVLSGGGGFTKDGDGTLVLNNAGNTYTGTSIVNAGTLNLNGNASQLTVNSGARLQGGTNLAAGTGTADTLTLENGSLSTFRLGTTSDQINITGTDGFTVVSGATHTATIVPAGQLNVNDEFVLFDYEGTIQGDGVSGIAASLPNPHYGFSVNNDVANTQVKLKIDSIDALIWTGAGGSTWDVETTTSWKTESAGTPTDFYEFDIVKFDDTGVDGTVTLSGSINPATTEFDVSSNSYTLAGAGIAGAGGLTKKGTATTILTNTNTYTGLTDVQAGILQVGDGGTSGTLGGSGNVNVATGATLAFNRSDNTTFARTVVGGGDLVKDGAGDLTMTGGNHAVDITINDGTLLARGGGWPTGFAPGQTITVNAGGTLDTVTHSLGGLGAGGILPGDIHLNGGTWQLNNEQYTPSLTMTGGLTTGPGEVRTTGGGIYTINATAGGSEMGARLSLVGNKTIQVADGAAAADLLVSGPIVGGAQITKTGAGRMLLTGTNTASGNFFVSEGRLALDGDNSGRTGGYEVTGGILEVSSVGDAAIGTGFIAPKDGTLEYNGSGAETTTRTLWIDGAGQSGTFDITNAGANLTVAPGGGNVNQEVIKTGAGTLTMQGVISGGGAVTNNGGTIVLDAVHTYTGNTTINAGTVALAAGASINNSANIIVGASTTLDVTAVPGFTVAAGQTLTGTGTVAGNTAADGTVAPGLSPVPGTLSVNGDLALGATSLLDIEVAGNLVSQYDSLNITGDLTVDGTVALNLVGYSPVLGDSFDLVDWTGTATGSPTFDFSSASLDPGLNWDTSNFLTDGTVVVIPEPATVLLAGLAAFGLTVRRRRR